MRKTFAPLDDILIERMFQPLLDLIMHRIGVGRRMAACFCLDIASLAWIVSRAGGLSDAVAARDGVAAFFNASLLLLGLVALLSLRTLFRRAGAVQSNPLRLMMRPHRAIVLLMLVVQVMQYDTADVAMLTFAAFALYLGACSERPPVRRTYGSLVPAS